MQSIARSGTYILAGRVVSAFAGFAGSVILAKAMPKGDLAEFFIIQTAIYLLTIVSLAGFPQLLMYEVPKLRVDNQLQRLRTLETTALAVVLAGSVAIFSSGAFVLWWCLEIGPKAALCAFAWGVGMTMTLIACEVGRLNNAPVTYALLASQGPWGGPVLAACILLQLGSVLAFGGIVDIVRAIEMYAVASVTSGAIAIWLAMRSEKLLPLRIDVHFAKRAAPYIFVPVISVYQVTDVWLLSSVLGIGAVATYGIASRLSSMAAMPTATIDTIVSPYLSAALHPEARHTLAAHLLLSARTSQVVGFAMLIFGIGLSSWFVDTFYGQDFAAAATPLAILLSGRALAAFFGPVNPLMIASGNGSRLLIFQITGAGIALLLGTVGGLVLGASGVASAYAVSIALVAFLTYRDLRRRVAVDSMSLTRIAS